MTDRDRQRREQGRSKWLAMAIASWRALIHYRHRELLISTEGRVERRRTPLVFVGNNEYTLEYPEMGARERLDGGALCLYVVRGSGAAKLLPLAARAMLGTIDGDRDLERVDGLTTLTIATREPRLPVAVDGEVVTLSAPLVYRIRPRALNVLAPADGAPP